MSRLPWWLVVVVGRRPKRTLLRAAVLIVLAVFVFKVVLLPIRVEGISMAPTYRNGGVNFVNRLAYKWREPQRGDVVAIQYAGKKVMLMKRIVGLPGERIGFEGGKLLINGEPMDEPYVEFPCHWAVETETVAQGYYFVVGDNRSMAPWDHTMGRVSRQRIVGRVLL